VLARDLGGLGPAVQFGGLDGVEAVGLPRRLSSRRGRRGRPASSRICHTVCAEIGTPWLVSSSAIYVTLRFLARSARTFSRTSPVALRGPFVPGLDSVNSDSFRERTIADDGSCWLSYSSGLTDSPDPPCSSIHGYAYTRLVSRFRRSGSRDTSPQLTGQPSCQRCRRAGESRVGCGTQLGNAIVLGSPFVQLLYTRRFS
jgi:hypothetical protein